MLGDELKRFISGQEDIDFNNVSKDLEMMLYSTAKKLGRKLDPECASELLSQFKLELFSKKEQFPLSIEYCFSFSKRLVYSAVDQNYTSWFLENPSKDPASYNSRYSNVLLHFKTSYPNLSSGNMCEFDFCNSDIISSVSLLPIHKVIKDTIVKVIESTDPDTLIDMAKSDDLLGSILKASFLNSFNTSHKTSDKSVFPFTIREEEVMLGCTLVKVPKKWVLPTYILMGDDLFLTVMRFMGSVLAPDLSSYFTNVLLSVRVFCVMEKFRQDRSEEDAIKDCGHRFSIRFRDVKNRVGRIERLFTRYDQRARQISSEIGRNFRGFYRSKKY